VKDDLPEDDPEDLPEDEQGDEQMHELTLNRRRIVPKQIVGRELSELKGEVDEPRSKRRRIVPKQTFSQELAELDTNVVISSTRRSLRSTKNQNITYNYHDIDDKQFNAIAVRNAKKAARR